MNIFKRAKKTKENKIIEVRAPFDGKVLDLENIKDEVFSKKIMGEGVVIIPSSDIVFSPIEGQLSSSFPTGHAYTITSKQGHGILLHIGIDTVELNGEGFSKVAEKGIKLSSETSLCKLDLKLIKKKARSLESPIILLNDETMKQGHISFKCKQGDLVKKGQVIFTIT